MEKAQLVTYPSLVEAPLIIVKIGDYTFGGCSKASTQTVNGRVSSVTFPNFLESINITKINGQVNVYTIKMIYGITKGDDPNLIDKVLSTVKDTRRINITYGDAAYPEMVYANESAIITKVQTNINFAGSQIQYTIHATSDAIQLKANNYTFPKREAKPSDVVNDMLYSGKYGLLDVFPGMKNRSKVMEKGLIATDDKVVPIEIKQSMNALDYLNFLANNMSSNTYVAVNSIIKDAIYMLNINDDISGELGGQYFEIKKVPVTSSSSSSSSANSTSANFLASNPYEVTVGYPGDNFVVDFKINSDEGYSILYDYGNTINGIETVYKIDSSGNITKEFSPAMARSSDTFHTNSAEKGWWTKMTQFPVTATLTLKGLLRPSILMSYIKINAVFFGQRHTSSGTYIITRQDDTVDGRGYRTTLTLLRVQGE
jgi:hypothetical protein